jgi:hypothetical protein
MNARVEPLTITREELYELVWSKPMVELARDFGLSDVAVAKRCRKLGVPVPGRGYWARVAAGQTPRQSPLKPRDDKVADYSALTFAPPKEESDAPKAPDTLAAAALREEIDKVEIKLDSDLRQACAPVRRTAAHLRCPWRREIAWNRGERTGPIISISVSDAVVDRALVVCERLLVAAETLGWTFGVANELENRGGRREFNPREKSPVCLTPHTRTAQRGR